MNATRAIVILVVVCAAVLAWSAIRPCSYDVWAFEIAAGVIGVAILAAIHRRFRFSNLVYVLVGIHFAILAVAAKYTYAEMPLFNWLRDTLHLARNHYDRVGHFALGFFPVLTIREVLLRRTPLQRGGWLTFLLLSVVLAIGAFWELVEWWTTLVVAGDTGAAFLGSQGDVWDAQWDMFCCGLGALASLLALSRTQDRQMRDECDRKI